MNATQKAVILSATHETQDGGILTCPQCGKPITQRTGHKKKFCSDRCRMDYWNSHQDQVLRKAYYTLVCKNCGQTFRCYGNAHRKFCCRSCYENYRKRGNRYDG